MGCDSSTGVRKPDRGRYDVQEYGFISFSQMVEDKWLPIVGKRDKNAFMGLKSGFKELYKYKGTLGGLGALGTQAEPCPQNCITRESLYCLCSCHTRKSTYQPLSPLLPSEKENLLSSEPKTRVGSSAIDLKGLLFPAKAERGLSAPGSQIGPL